MKYDAFISYSQPDEDLVETEIVNYLEEHGFKICWHQRDFMPGTNIAENIADATEHSRRIIIVISRTYVESEWCMKEFRDADAHATGNARKKFLIPLLCGDVTEGDLATDLKFYLENHTYIKHKNVGDMKKRLLKAMPHIPLLELRPELREENETRDNPNDTLTQQDATDHNNQSVEAEAGDMEANTTFHDLKEHVGVKHGVMQRVKRFLFKKKIDSSTAKDDSMSHGDDQISESDNEEDLQDGIRLVRRHKRK